MSASATDIGLIVQRAYGHARSGDLDGAATLCSDVLQADPWHPGAWLLRAAIAMRKGAPYEALPAARRALPMHPAPAQVHALMGDALRELNQPLEALESYQAALRIDTGLASALFGQGRALMSLRRHREALASFDALLRSEPRDFEVLMMRASAQFEVKDHLGALDSYERATALQPGNADAHCNRGAVLLLIGRPEEALRSLDAALSLSPALTEAHLYRGEALRRLGEPEAALRAIEQALQARPESVDAHVSQGELLRELKRPERALQSFERARVLRADSAGAQRGIGDAWLDLGRPAAALAAHAAALRLGGQRALSLASYGNSLRALGRHVEALAAFDESLSLEPRNAAALCDRACTRLLAGDGGAATAARAIADYAQALELNPNAPFVPGVLHYMRMLHGDWSAPVATASAESILRAVRAGLPACAPFAFLSLSDDAAAQLECARVFTRHQVGPCPPERSRPRYRHERVRLAYVSADLRAHAVSYLLAGVFERHDRGRFEVSAIALRPADQSPTGSRVRAAFDHFVDASAMTDQEVVELMRGMEIDIAVDLTGYTQGCRPRILAAGAAPIQATYLGYPGTMGAAFIDYLIADDFVLPAERSADYGEAIAYLPECFQANDDRRVIAERGFTRVGQGLPEAAVVLCCLNHSHKINSRMFDVWMRILAQAPQAVLWLLSHEREVEGNLRREAALRGIDPDRLVFAERLPYPEYLERLKLADLFLDTLPFNAGATASDALWAGVPVLTCAGDAYAGRMAGSLLRALDLSGLITTNLTDYESLAVRLAVSPALLAQWRARLAATRLTAPLFDTARFTTHLEAAYLEMWRRHERGEVLSTFAVDPIAAR